MTPTNVFYEFLARGDESGNLAGMHYQERTIYTDDSGAKVYEQMGDLQPIAAGSAQLATILGALNSTALAQVQTLTTQLAAVQQSLTDAQSTKAADEATIAQLTAQIATLTAPPTDATALLLGKLRAVFATIPPADQVQFAQGFATVNVLVNNGAIPLAIGYVESIDVPADMADAKAQILALLQGA